MEDGQGLLEKASGVVPVMTKKLPADTERIDASLTNIPFLFSCENITLLGPRCARHSSITRFMCFSTCLHVRYIFVYYQLNQRPLPLLPTPVSATPPQEFREFPLLDIQEKTHNVRRFRMGLPSDEHVMGMKTASCIVVRGEGQNGDMVVRPYTPTTTNDTKVRASFSPDRGRRR